VSETKEQAGGRLAFLDSLARIFRGKEGKKDAAAARPQAASRFDHLQADFEAALRGLDEKVRASRATTASPGSIAVPRQKTAEERAAESQRRMEEAHRAIREDIEKMHARLGTGLSSTDLVELTATLEDLEATSTAGKDSHSLLPRARYAIAERFLAQAGELAVARLVALLEREKLAWPDPTHHRPSASPEEVERSRRRRLAETREAFLASGFQKTGERMLGIVRGWGSDYPDRGTPLWEESVLEGVAAGIRGQLLKEFVECLQRDRDLILSQTEELIGKELAALQKALESGVTVEQAQRASAASLHVVDQMVPEIAWEQVRAKSSHARGEF
jgi:hypothetical protein